MVISSYDGGACTHVPRLATPLMVKVRDMVRVSRPNFNYCKYCVNSTLKRLNLTISTIDHLIVKD